MSLQDASKFNIGATEFDWAFSDLSQKTPEGTLYLYKFNADKSSWHQLCSLECAYDFSVKNNSLVFYPDEEREGYTRGLSPDIIKINRALGIPDENKYRGQPGFKMD